MKYLLLAIVLFITTPLFTCINTPILNSKKTETKLIYKEIITQPTAKEKMITDIIAVWTMFLDDAKCNKKDPRRKDFPIFAEELADAIIMYQDNPTDIGGQLPKEREISILLAVNVTKESSLYSNLVGADPRNEVGLMQVHGVALAGYNPKLVQENSRLGLLLGVRWFASRMNKCKTNRVSGDNVSFRIEDIIGPQTLYQAGGKALKNGKCQKYGVARKRINLTKLYISRIDTATQG